MKFVAFERAKQGTGASRRLRNTGKTPGIIYGGQGQPQLIELDHNALWHALKKEAFHSTILDMELAGQTAKVLLHDVQAEESQAVKHENCVVNHVMSEIDISCLPADLPESIDVDLSGMKKGMSLHLNDITLPKGVTAVTRGKPNPVLVSMVIIGGEEVAEPGAAEAAAATAAPAAEAKAPAAAKGGDTKAPAAKAGEAKGGDAKAADAKAAPAKAPAAKK